jgi:hypothetical protein
MDYATFSYTSLKRRMTTSPVDTPDYIKAAAELNRRHKTLALRVAMYGALIAALGIIARIISN